MGRPVKGHGGIDGASDGPSGLDLCLHVVAPRQPPMLRHHQALIIELQRSTDKLQEFFLVQSGAAPALCVMKSHSQGLQRACQSPGVAIMTWSMRNDRGDQGPKLPDIQTSWWSISCHEQGHNGVLQSPTTKHCAAGARTTGLQVWLPAPEHMKHCCRLVHSLADVAEYTEQPSKGTPFDAAYSYALLSQPGCTGVRLSLQPQQETQGIMHVAHMRYVRGKRCMPARLSPESMRTSITVPSVPAIEHVLCR